MCQILKIEKMESVSKFDSFSILNKIDMQSLPLARAAFDYIDFLLKEKNNRIIS
jgi:hypothetical protein